MVEVSKIFSQYHLFTFSHKEKGYLFKCIENNDFVRISAFFLTKLKEEGIHEGEGYTYYDNNILNRSAFNVKFNLESFVVFTADLPSFIKYIKENIDPNVNEGPQKNRGQVNEMGYILSTLDEDFRSFLYYNAMVSQNARNIEHKDRLYQGDFSFQNVHVKAGFLDY